MLVIRNEQSTTILLVIVGTNPSVIIDNNVVGDVGENRQTPVSNGESSIAFAATSGVDRIISTHHGQGEHHQGIGGGTGTGGSIGIFSDNQTKLIPIESCGTIDSLSQVAAWLGQKAGERKGHDD
ncbi:Uncharacterized protein Fot_39537 [Forsythia ovata]|uniref:Uncharacterized protein n=1 Tax=Forsythia ovata TaxID=205694 RepID=A0ABD1S525_9LAMI